MSNETTVDIAVLRRGTEGLSTAEYADEIRKRLPNYEVKRARTPREEQELIESASVVTGVSVDDSVVSQSEHLELFSCVFSGVDHLPLSTLQQKQVVVTNASGIHAPGIAEQALGKVLLFSRNLHIGIQRKQNNEWRHYKGQELTGSTVTILGLGSVGRQITNRLHGFDVHTVGIRYTPSKGGPTDEVLGLDTEAVHDALARSEYVIIACPLTDETRELIGREELITLPPNAVVINVGRGEIIDTDALLWALQDESIRGAALDVTEPEPLPPDHPLWDLNNVIITPHMAGHTPKHWSRLAGILAHNVRALETNDYSSIRNVVVSKHGETEQYVGTSTNR